MVEPTVTVSPGSRSRRVTSPSQWREQGRPHHGHLLLLCAARRDVNPARRLGALREDAIEIGPGDAQLVGSFVTLLVRTDAGVEQRLGTPRLSVGGSDQRADALFLGREPLQGSPRGDNPVFAARKSASAWLVSSRASAWPSETRDPSSTITSLSLPDKSKPTAASR